MSAPNSPAVSVKASLYAKLKQRENAQGEKVSTLADTILRDWLDKNVN